MTSSKVNVNYLVIKLYDSDCYRTEETCERGIETEPSVF